MKHKSIEIGRLLRANLSGFVAGCRLSQPELPSFGTLVRVPIQSQMEAYGIIYDIRMDDDGLVRQLVTSQVLPPEVIADNRANRNKPVEISIITIGRNQEGVLSHLLPPRPPISLDLIYECTSEELRAFTSLARFGYFRHILRNKEIAIGELLAAHFEQARNAHMVAGNHEWFSRASKELIIQLRDDYPSLMNVLNALSDLPMEIHNEQQ